ncbi:hypothetical protein F4778DRAFT_364700 [Xylariomycetidae sp. FL2044]|nr:hypothetical protein F4778DRAFT_364700 [Xylariomycetidae sp. FL2044]
MILNSMVRSYNVTSAQHPSVGSYWDRVAKMQNRLVKRHNDLIDLHGFEATQLYSMARTAPFPDATLLSKTNGWGHLNGNAKYPHDVRQNGHAKYPHNVHTYKKLVDSLDEVPAPEYDSKFWDDKFEEMKLDALKYLVGISREAGESSPTFKDPSPMSDDLESMFSLTHAAALRLVDATDLDPVCPQRKDRPCPPREDYTRPPHNEGKNEVNSCPATPRSGSPCPSIDVTPTKQSPKALSPKAFSPRVLSPKAVGLSPKVFSPKAFSPKISFSPADPIRAIRQPYPNADGRCSPTISDHESTILSETATSTAVAQSGSGSGDEKGLNGDNKTLRDGGNRKKSKRGPIWRPLDLECQRVLQSS